MPRPDSTRARVFVDTGVLVAAHDTNAGARQAAASHALRQVWEDGSGVVSTQVLDEFYRHVTEEIVEPLLRRDARDLITPYRAWSVVALDADDLFAASDAQDRFKLAYADALVLVAASKGRATTLLSEAFLPYRQLAGIDIRNPFA